MRIPEPAEAVDGIDAGERFRPGHQFIIKLKRQVFTPIAERFLRKMERMLSCCCAVVNESLT